MSDESDVSPGDRITVGSTHQVKIDGQDAWIKGEANIAVREGETSKDTARRAGKAVAGFIVTEIERQASVMLEANAAQQRR